MISRERSRKNGEWVSIRIAWLGIRRGVFEHIKTSPKCLITYTSPSTFINTSPNSNNHLKNWCHSSNLSTCSSTIQRTLSPLITTTNSTKYIRSRLHHKCNLSSCHLRRRQLFRQHIKRIMRSFRNCISRLRGRGWTRWRECSKILIWAKMEFNSIKSWTKSEEWLTQDRERGMSNLNLVSFPPMTINITTAIQNSSSRKTTAFQRTTQLFMVWIKFLTTR